ncbi:MAG: hypothetical protein K0S65_5501 [Labilithrix sp.]|nr:hypothetical protein [Labilithrix sp.]
MTARAAEDTRDLVVRHLVGVEMNRHLCELERYTHEDLPEDRTGLGARRGRMFRRWMALGEEARAGPLIPEAVQTRMGCCAVEPRRKRALSAEGIRTIDDGHEHVVQHLASVILVAENAPRSSQDQRCVLTVERFDRP